MADARVIPDWRAAHERYRRAIRLLVERGYLLRVHKGGRRARDPHRYRFVKGGPMTTPRLVASTQAPAIDEDMRRVADAIRSGMSIRETAAALSLDKSKVLRLKKRAQSETPQGQAPREHPNRLTMRHPEVSHRRCLTPQGTMYVYTPPLPPAPPAAIGVSLSGCFLSLPVGDGLYRRCDAPLSPDGVYCHAHSVIHS